MSLTNLIKKDKGFKQIFKEEVDNVKSLFVSDDGSVPFHKDNKIVVPPPIDSNPYSHPGNVGTAYDYWFRAYLQRMNQISMEIDMDDIVMGGYNAIKNILSKQESKSLKEKIKTHWVLRVDYINGKEVDEDELLKGMIVFSYCVNHFRANIPLREKTYLEPENVEFVDLKSLIENTKNNLPSFFDCKNNIDSIELNPTFGKNSTLVGGADADLIVHNTLIDLKSTKDFSYKGEHAYQIIGYYILDKYNDSKTRDTHLEKIGFYYPRYNRFVFMNTNELEERVDIERLWDRINQYLN